jgi:Polysaccharide deacetylase
MLFSTLLISIIIIIISAAVLSPPVSPITLTYAQTSSSSSSSLHDIDKGNSEGTNITNNNTEKVVILNFYDNPNSQFTNAKPILDKYNLKVSFFVVCNWLGSNSSSSSSSPSSNKRMTWQDISSLQKDGQDIESHTMNHRNLNELSNSELNYEVGQSKKCLSNHGINASVFAAPHGDEWKNATVIDAVSKYYNLALGGFSELMFLHCDGYKKESPKQTDCRTYFDNGTLTPVNRYSIREWSHNANDESLSFNDSKIFKKFIEEVNEQLYFKSGEKPLKINAIPIIGYHSIDNNKTKDSTDIDLFAEEMKYLYDNNFKVLTMSDLGFDKSNNYLYLKNVGQ